MGKSTFWRLQQSCKRKKNVLAFATILQMRKSTFRRLQQSCKRKKDVLAFATILQMRKSTFWRLQQSCKRKKSVLAFARLLQAFPKVIYPLVCSIFGHSMGMHKKAGPAMSNRKPCFVYQRKTDAPGGRCVVFMSSIQRSQPSAHPPERSRLP